MKSSFKNLIIDVIELDKDVYDVAVDYFGLKIDDKLNIYIDDGLIFIDNLLSETKANASKLQDLIVIDVNSTDQALEMAFPPEEFVTKEFLKKLYDCLILDGVCLFNIEQEIL